MDYETALKTCSEEVQAAIKWLEEQLQLRSDREKLENMLEKDQYWIGDISRRLEVKYLCSDALEFYVLSKVKAPLFKEFLDASKSEEFWLDEEWPEGFDALLFEEPYLLWYLSKVGLNSNEYFKDAREVFIKKPQTLEGKIPINPDVDTSHPLALRVLASVGPDSEATNMAVRYFLDNLDEFKSSYSHDLDALAIGVLALWELDYLKVKETIEDLCAFLKGEQKGEGYWGEIHQWKDGTSYPIKETSIIIEALSRVFGPNDECVIKAVEWIKSNKKEDGSWGHVNNTAYACLALMSVGEGPKIPQEEVEWKGMLMNQRLQHAKPYFVHTSPEYYEKRHIEDIQKTIRDMFQSAKSEIRILSPYIEILHDELIKLIIEKPDLSFKIITRPKKDPGVNKKVIDRLNEYTKGNCKTNWKIHSRMVIIDKNEVLISSSDFNRDGLIDQYNAGIRTRDKETVEDAIKFFENLWNVSNDKTQLTEEKGNKHEQNRSASR